MNLRVVVFLPVVLAIGASRAFAADWDPILEVQLFKQSDWIVVGEVSARTETEWTIDIDRVIFGKEVDQIEISALSPFFYNPIPEGETRIFGLKAYEGGVGVIHPDAIRPVEHEQKIKRAAKLYETPANFLVDLGNQNLVHVIGEFFEKQSEPANGLARTDAVAYLRGCAATDDIVLRRKTFDTLALIEEWSAVPQVCKLLENLDGDSDAGHGVYAAVRYLGKSKKPKAIATLEQLLTKHGPKYPEKHWLCDPIAEQLGKAGFPSSLPVIKEAARHGVSRAKSALIWLGDEETFEEMMAVYLESETVGGQAYTLDWLVRRSNKKHEDWMTPNAGTTEILLRLKPNWKAWWEANHEGFELVKTGHEVVKEALAKRRAAAPPQSRPDRRTDKTLE